MTFLMTSILVSIISLVNAALHSLGAYVLVSIYSNGRKTSQQVFLINLSFVGSLSSIVSLLHGIDNILGYYYYHWHIIDEISNYLFIINITGLFYLFYLSIMFVTLDRLMSSLLTFRYIIYWDHLKAIKLLIASWCIITSVCIFLVNDFEKMKSNGTDRIIIEYVPSAFDAAVIILAMASYGIIFSRYVTSRRLVSHTERNESMLQIFRNSKFYVTILLISSFLVLTVIPGSILSIFAYTNIEVSESFYVYTTVSFCLSTTADVIIYLFMHKTVRKVCLQKLSCKNKKNCCLMKRKNDDVFQVKFQLRDSKGQIKGSIFKSSSKTSSSGEIVVVI